MRNLLKKQGFAPDVLVTDKLRSPRRSRVCRLVTSRLAQEQSDREFPTQHGGGSARCSASNRRDQPNAFYRLTPPSSDSPPDCRVEEAIAMSEVFVSRRQQRQKRPCNCCIAALRCCGAGSRPYMPSLGVSSLDSRPPQGGLLFGDDRPGSSNHDARFTAAHLPLLPVEIVGIPLQD